MQVLIVNASTKLTLPNWLNKTITRLIASAPLARAGTATDAIDANILNGECFNIIAENMVNTMLINGITAIISNNKASSTSNILDFLLQFLVQCLYSNVFIYKNRLNCIFIIIQLSRYVNIVMKISKILLDIYNTFIL